MEGQPRSQAPDHRDRRRFRSDRRDPVSPRRSFPGWRRDGGSARPATAGAPHPRPRPMVRGASDFLHFCADRNARVAVVTTPIVALDVPTASAARALVDLLGDECRFYKVGSELFTAAGPEVLRILRAA